MTQKYSRIRFRTLKGDKNTTEHLSGKNVIYILAAILYFYFLLKNFYLKIEQPNYCNLKFCIMLYDTTGNLQKVKIFSSSFFQNFGHKTKFFEHFIENSLNNPHMTILFHVLLC